MLTFKRFVIILVFLLCVYPGKSYAIQAFDFKNYFPDQISDFRATGDVSTEDLTQSNGMFHRAQRIYSSTKGATCILAFVKGASVPQTIEETFAKGSKIKIDNFDAVNIPSENNMLSASVKLDKDFLITAVVINSKDKEAPIKILKKLKLFDLLTINKKH